MTDHDSNDLPLDSATQPLFTYTATPPQVETSADTDNPVTLSLGVYNPKVNGAVSCQYIEFAISIGNTLESQLTDDAADVQAQSNQEDWVIEKLPYMTSPLIFKATPQPGTTGLDPGESISFLLTGINVNDVEGDAPVSIAEGTATPPAMTQVLINKVSPSLQIVLFQVVPASLQPDEPATLSWQTAGANLCTIDQLEETSCQTPPDPLPLDGDVQVCPQATTTYTLTAYDSGGGYRESQATVSVIKATVVSLDASPDTLDYTTQTSILTWTVEYATTLTLTSPGSRMTVTGTSQPVTPDVTSRDTTFVPYTLEAVNDDNQTTDSMGVDVYVNQAAIQSFGASPAEFVHGQPVTLSWITEYAESCSIDQGVGAAAPASGGTLQLEPEATTTYTLTAAGLGVADTRTAKATLQPSGWNPAATPPGVPSLLLSFQGRLWLFSLWSDTSLYSSVDGTNWTLVADDLPFGNRMFCAGAVFDDGGGEKMWVMGGMNSTEDFVWTPLNDVWSSVDGVNWTQAQTNNIWSGRLGLACVAFQNQLWALGGFDLTPGKNEPANWAPLPDNVWSSPDGVNWTQAASAPWGARGLIGAAVFNPTQPAGINQLWMCGGSPGAWAFSGLADAWYTNDGATWTQAATPAWTARAGASLVMLNDQLWLLGGFQPFTIVGQFLTDMWAMGADLAWTQSAAVPSGFLFWDYIPIASTFNYRLWLAGPVSGGPMMQCYNP